MVHAGSGRRRGKARSRILYWFRTPPGVRVGRAALDEDAIRLIEAHNPDVEFDWTRILKGQDAPVESKPVPNADRRARPRPREFPPRSESPRIPAAVVHSLAPGPLADAPAEPIERAAERLDESIDRVDEAAIAELLSDGAPEPAPGESGMIEPSSPAQARLGSEGLSRIRARHAEVLARISETVTDAVRRDELKSQADRLNPDTWVTAAEVSAGLEAYETVFESLRTVIGSRRTRRKRSGRPQAVPPAGTEQESSQPNAIGGEDADTPDGSE